MRHRTAFHRAALAALVLVAGLGAAPASAASDREVTEALIWTGVSSRVARSRLDRRDRVPIRLAEDRIGGYPDGVLDGGERRALLAAARHARAREGYRVVTDSVTGARIGLPTAWLGRRDATEQGSSWRSPDGAITVETFRRPGTLAALARAERRRGTDVTYDVARGNWRVVSGYAGDGRTVYARAAERDGEVSGFRVIYETGLGPRLDRVAVAMSSDFRAFAAPSEIDALAYAPRDDRRFDDGRFDDDRFDDDRFDDDRRFDDRRFGDDGFERVERPRYAILPDAGPQPRARPLPEIASLEPVRPFVGPLEERAAPPEARPEPQRPRADFPRPQPVEPRQTGPIDLFGDEETALAPPRPLDRPVPDTGEAEGSVPSRITGLVTDEGQSCPTLRGPDGTLYALVGEVPSLSPGTLVTVETVGVDTEACTAGRTVAVGGLQVLQSP